MEKVDVVVIGYNEESIVNECLDAILKNPEVGKVIFVDDGSTDNTLGMVKGRKDRNGNIIVKRNEKNMGRGYSRMCGFKETTSDKIAFVDADTVVDKDWMKIMLKGFKGKDKRGKTVDVVIGLLHFTSKNPNVYTGYIQKVMENLFSQSNASSAMVFKRKLLEEYPIDTTIRDGEDMDWVCRLMKANITFNTLDEYVGTHYCDMTIMDLVKRYYEYGRNRAYLHMKYPDVIKVSRQDTETSEYVICTIIENLRNIAGSLGYKSVLIEEGWIHDREQKRQLHSS